jgi:hypothetical protein
MTSPAREVMGCREVFLVYSRPLPRLLEIWIGNIRVRSPFFPLDEDIAAAGDRYMRKAVGDALGDEGREKVGKK